MTVNKDGETLFDLSSLEGSREDPAGDDRIGEFAGIRFKRMFAYIVDVVCIFMIGVVASTVASLMSIISFGALTPLLVIGLALIPLAYHTLTIGGQWHATLGMRLFGIEVCLKNGDYPDYLTALLHSGIFYFTMAVTSSLILIVSVFNTRGSLLHDYLTQSVVRLKSEVKPNRH